MALDGTSKTATLYRIIMPDQPREFGLKSKDLLARHGLAVGNHHFQSRDETEAIKKKHGADTTPQTFIGGDRMGGYEDLRAHFGKAVEAADETSFKPVIAIPSVAFPRALSVDWYTLGTVFSSRTVEQKRMIAGSDVARYSLGNGERGEVRTRPKTGTFPSSTCLRRPAYGRVNARLLNEALDE